VPSVAEMIATPKIASHINEREYASAVISMLASSNTATTNSS